MYEIRYLPLARKDLAAITNYIADHLKASKAAMDLLDSLDEAISRLGQFPYSCKGYYPIKAMTDEYRMLPVKNYAVFYTVKEQMVEIHRIVYSKMDLSNIIRE